MDATRMKLLLASWGASDPALGDVEGDAYPLRLAGAGPVPVEIDQDPDVPARLLVRADLSAEGAGDTGEVLDAVTRSRAGLLEATTAEGRVRVQHAWYAEELDRHAFMGALAEVNRAVRQIQAEAGLFAAAPPAGAAGTAAAVPAAASQPVPPQPVVTPPPTTPIPAPVPTPAPAPSVDAAALAGVPAVWRRTHTTAPGARAWSAPNPALPPLMDLAPGTELRVLERLGQWARVDAANGWTGWVDAQLLVPG
jgi:hypothetical protein